MFLNTVESCETSGTTDLLPTTSNLVQAHSGSEKFPFGRRDFTSDSDVTCTVYSNLIIKIQPTI
jgi:hypothetical protein